MNKNNNLAVVAYTNFSRDSRVQKETYAAYESGYNLDIYTLKHNNLGPFKSYNFIDIDLEQYRGTSQGKYLLSYFKFFFSCFFYLTKNYVKKRYKIVHFHNMPNFLVFSAIIPKLFGAKIILDIHDLMPELFSVKFQKPVNHFIIKLFYFEERISAKFANVVIATNSFHINRFIKNGINKEKITEIVNVADEKIFYAPSQNNIKNEELIIAYPSTLSKRLGIDNLLEAVEMLNNKGVKLKLNIYGDGDYRNEILEILKNKNLENVVKLSDSFVTLENLSSELDKADVGIIPLPSDRSNDIAMPVKIYEFFAKKICVVASDLPLMTSCFNDSVIFFKAGDSEDLADKIEYLAENKDVVKKFAERGYKIFSSQSWSYYKSKYQNIIITSK
ncbi:MAG: glycosyltransferase [Ignavibacteriales bacterium]|nr:glycosyltransferase [Ignavibacteriota bacterium]MCB9207169.1 glycosyltransferase [Ignavibacteriales bacterium]MCB9210993.1 glycosyltransferase [Ignavibacteriales bacterium]